MAMTLITTNTESGDAESVFSSGIDDTYKLYIFKFIDVNPVYNGAKLGVQFNATDSTSYDETITSTFFNAFYAEAGDPDYNLTYQTAVDQAEGTAVQWITREIGGEADESGAGTLWLFNPSSTTYVKHFYSRIHSYYHADYAIDNFVAGYINTTTAIDDVKFTVEGGGNFDAVIKMYGVG